MIAILKQFIKAERVGNCIYSMSQILPFLAASWHKLYKKSSYIYLQNMVKLPSTYPKVYKLFQEGYHVIRRSDRYRAGLSTYLIIEQMFMRNLKKIWWSYKGKMHGRGTEILFKFIIKTILKTLSRMIKIIMVKEMFDARNNVGYLASTS